MENGKSMTTTCAHPSPFNSKIKIKKMGEIRKSESLEIMKIPDSCQKCKKTSKSTRWEKIRKM